MLRVTTEFLGPKDEPNIHDVAYSKVSVDSLWSVYSCVCVCVCLEFIILADYITKVTNLYLPK